jgi:hypothetical protein
MLKLNVKQIAEGWGNYFLDKLSLLDEGKKKVAETRMVICENCPVKTDNICDTEKTGYTAEGTKFSGCGCFLDKKVLCMDCECPGSYWKPVKL